MKIHNGQEKFQTYYICDDCGKKNKIFITREVIYINCVTCGKRMRKQEATVNGFPDCDTFGNFFIAGKFGVEKSPQNKADKSLYEIWGAK